MERDLSESLNLKPTEWRCCAICFQDILRADYNSHMQSHGYELIEIQPGDDSE